jgi:hypothetical protein
MKTKKQQRNGHACHAIMRKGGVHEESKTGKRRKTKNDTQKQIQAWRDHAGSLFLATNLAA